MAFVIEGRGSGVRSLAECVDDEKVMFGVIRFNMGSGQFQRQKYVFLHINGDKTPPMKRMKHNSKMDDAMAAVGQPIHVTMQFGSRYEVTSDAILESMLRLMRVDGGTDYEKTVALMRAEVEAQCNAEPEPEPARGRRRTVTQHKLSKLFTGVALEPRYDFAKTLAELRSAEGTLTYMVIDPEPAEPVVIGCGAGSLPALITELDDAKVLFALCRMNFGEGRFRRSTLVFMHFVGDGVGGVKRGRLNAKKGDIMDWIGVGKGITAIDYTANGLDETDPADVIAAVAKSVVSDDMEAGENMFSLEAFMKALEEDAVKANAHCEVESSDEEGDDDAAGMGGGRGAETLGDLVRIIHSDNPIYSWMLVSVVE